MSLDLIDEQQAVLQAQEQSILVTARPGRGKTTVALLLARRLAQDGTIGQSQQALLLTYSRNAVYQIEQAGGRLLNPRTRQRLWIATYHSFMWWLLSAFGRFHGLPSRLHVSGKAKTRAGRQTARLTGIEPADVPVFLAKSFSAISYDEFAPLALSMLRESESIRGAIRGRFPVVVVDEFQDTNDEQWELVKIISDESRLVCLADPDQRIFGWRGASDDRIAQFLDQRQGTQYSLQSRCLRTCEHDLLDFAEAILDNEQGSPSERRKWQGRFLRRYPGSNALGTYVKMAIRDFHADFRKRNSKSTLPTIAIAGHSNSTARDIRDSLAESTPKGPMTYHCNLLQDEEDDALDQLLVHLAAYAAGSSQEELERAIQLVGGILVNRDADLTAPLQSLFNPRDLLCGNLKPVGTAKHVLEVFSPVRELPAAAHVEAMARASAAVRELANRVKAVGGIIKAEYLAEREAELARMLSNMGAQPPLSAIERLREQLSGEKLRRDVIERLLPSRGIVSSTLHKLKGREFDYICIVTRSGDRLGASDARGDDSEARRLLYVALTRPRFDARVLFVESNPCFLVRPYLQ